MLRVAEILLEDAGVAAPALTTVSKFVAEQEQAQLQRSLGRIEPRSRFKYKSGHPLHEGRKLSQVFVDECGIPSPQPGVENGTFALGAVAFQDEAITLESQGPKEDALHQLEYARLLLGGTQWVPPSAFQQTIEPGARFVPKSGSHPTELADMFARDLFEWVRQGCTGDPKRWSRFSPKIYGRGNRSMGTFGVKVFPDSDIREQVERHRMVSGN